MVERRIRARPMLIGATLVATLLASALAPRQEPTAPFPRQGKYLGKEACRDCHDDKWDELAASPHGSILSSELLHGCETCHGPGAAHGDDPDNDPRKITFPPSLAPAKQTAICVQCHADQIAGHGGDPAGFLAAGKGCTSCHEIHHDKRAAPHAGVVFGRRTDSLNAAEPIGSQKCIECHPLRDRSLQSSPHSALAVAHDAGGCEKCHGNGSLHAASGGVARLISRPDRAGDGIATCRSCHAGVDAVDFHWAGRHKPLLGDGLRCTTCHRIHAPAAAGTAAAPPAVDTARAKAVPANAVPTNTAPTNTVPTNTLCAKCHEPAFSVLHGTIHETLGRRDAPLATGCGACHAGAEQHARAGGRKQLVDSLHGTSAAHQLATCTRCHDHEAALSHVRNGAHQRHEVTCLTCHSPAAPRGETREDAERKCAGCHQTVAADFRKPNHHPVPEGHMGCSDCHQPHSARPRIRDRRLKQQACVKCHPQYRGPFVFAHQASRLDGCIACHSPHGATNRRLLHQATTQQSCLQCHGDFPAFHDQTPGAVFTNCLNCHTEVHGSNHSRFLFR